MKSQSVMRRLAALLIMAAAGWLLVRTTSQFISLTELGDMDKLMPLLSSPDFIVPIIGGLFGLVGGAIVLMGGVGGAMLAIVGGVVAAGFAIYLEKPFWTGWEVWENDIAVGLGLLLIAGVAAITGRD
jgi:hypothetical protein